MLTQLNKVKNISLDIHQFITQDASQGGVSPYGKGGVHWGRLRGDLSMPTESERSC